MVDVELGWVGRGHPVVGRAPRPRDGTARPDPRRGPRLRDQYLVPCVAAVAIGVDPVDEQRPVVAAWVLGCCCKTSEKLEPGAAYLRRGDRRGTVRGSQQRRDEEHEQAGGEAG